MVKHGRGDQHPRIAYRHARANRLGTESRKQGADHAAVFPGAQCRNVKLGNAAGEDVDAFARAYSQSPQHVGEALGILA